MPQLDASQAERMRAWLVQEGFVATRTMGGATAGFGDQLTEWERDSVRVRLTRDRGEWWCDVSRGVSKIWLDALTAAHLLMCNDPDVVARIACVIRRLTPGAFVVLKWCAPRR